jgi:predicted RNA binding protein YcfA (HicA-like mRNA interferase family)
MPSPINRKASELIKMLEEVGYHMAKQQGSHKIFNHPDKESIIVVPDHAGRILPAAITASIIKNVISTEVASEDEINKAFEKKIN